MASATAYLTFLAAILQILSCVNAQTVTGCFPTNYSRPDYPEFGLSPVEYDVVDMTVSRCRGLCAEFGFDYAGLRNGEFCFCDSDAPTTVEDTGGTECNMDCTGDNSIKCGGAQYMDVFPAGKGFVGLAITPSVTTGDSFDMVTFTVTADLRPSSYNYQLEVISPSYYKMMGIAGINTTFDVHLSMAGKIVVSVLGTDSFDPISATRASTAVTMWPGTHNITVLCPPIDVTMEDVICNVTIMQGYQIQLAVDYGDATPTENINILDPVRFGIGSDFLSSDPVGPTGTATGLYIVRTQVAEQQGKLVALEYKAKAASCTFTALLLRATCTPGPPCPYSDSCTACPEYKVRTDCSSNSGCVTPTVVHDVAAATVEWSEDITVTAAGYGYTIITPPDDLLVEIGDALAVFDTTGGCLETVGRVPAGNSTFFKTGGSSPAVGTTVSGIAAAPKNNDVMIRAVVSVPTEVRLYHKYRAVGVYDVAVTAEANSVSTPATPQQVEILEGIDYVIIDHPEYHQSTVGVAMTLEPHTGCGNPGNCNYTWDFGDGTPSTPVEDLDTPTPPHVYASAGSYNICVTVENAVDSESNCSLIIIQDEIVFGTPALTPAAPVSTVGTANNFDLVLTSGTDANCTWTSTPVDFTDIQQIYATSGTYTEPVTFTASGLYDVEITCFNAISNKNDQLVAHKAQIPITRVDLVEPQPVYVSTAGPATLTVTSDGSDVKFDWTIDGTPYTGVVGTKDPGTGDFTAPQVHSYTSPGTVQMTVKAYNDLDPTGQITPSITVTAQNPVPDGLKIATNTPVTIGGAGLEVTVTMPPGTALPTDATVTVRDARGNVILVAEAITTNPFTTSAFQLPPPQGDQDITITVENEVSQVNKTETVASYHQLVDVAFTVQPKVLPSYVMAAGEYPMDTIVVKASTTANLTHFTKFTVQYRRDDWPTPQEQEYLTSEFEHTFPKDGIYTFTLVGSNPVSSTDDQKTITMIGGVRKMTVTALTDIARVDAPVQYQIDFESFGTQSCVFFHHGDKKSSIKGSFFSPTAAMNKCIQQYGQHLGGGDLFISAYSYRGVITNPLVGPDLMHTYTAEGTYEVIVQAYDCDETAVHRDSTFTAVSKMDCLNPDIKFPRNSIERNDPDIYLASKDIILTALITLNCTAQKNVRQWRLNKVNPAYPDNINRDEQIRLENAAGADQSILVIRQRTLTYGDYRADLEVTMVNDSAAGIYFSPDIQFKSVESLYFRVEKTAIISNMLKSPFSSVQVGTSQTFTLKPASFSEDPDIPRDSPQGFTGFEYGYVESASEPMLNDPALNCPVLVGQDGVNPSPGSGPFRGVTQSAFKQGEVKIDTNQLLTNKLQILINLGHCSLRIVETKSSHDANFVVTGAATNNEDKWYVFCTTVFKDTRNATNMLVVKPTTQIHPDVNIQCVSTDLCKHITTGIKVSATDSLVLAATCTQQPGGEPCGTTTSGAGANKWMLEFYDNTTGTWQSIPNAADYIIGDGTDKVRISAEAFQGHSNVRITVGQLTSSGNPAGTSPVQVLLTLNKPPICDNTILQPTSGVFLDQSFLLNVTNCIDPDNSNPESVGVQSMILYYAGEGTSRMLIGSAPLGGMESLLIGGTQPVRHKIYAKVSDVDGVSGFIYLGEVTVDPATDSARLEDFAFSDENMEQLNKTMYAGSFEENFDLIVTTTFTANVLAEKRNEILFQAADNNCNGAPGGTDVSFSCSALPHLIDGTTENINSAEYKAYQKGRDNLSRTFETMAYILGNSTTDTVDQAMTKCRIIKQMTANPENLVRDAQVSIVNTLAKSASVLVDRILELTPAEIEQAAEDIVASSANLMTGCVVCMNNSVPRDVEQQQENYNTDLETLTDPRIDEPKTEKELDAANLQQRTFQNFMEQKDSCGYQGNLLNQAKDDVVEMVASSLTPGKNLTIKTELVSQIIEAFTAGDYQGEIYKQLEGGVTVTLPPLRSLDPANKYEDDDHIFASFEVTAYNVLMFAATQHQIMPFKSRTSDVRVAKDDDRAGYGKINVNDADDDIHIQLPRKVPEPNVTDIAPLCPWVSKYVTMVFTKFDVRQSNSSVDMWLKVPRSNTKYLVQWGMEQPPNITNGIWEYSELVDVDDDDGNGEWLKQLQFGTDRVKSRTGPLFIALRELTDTEVTKIQAANVDPERGVEVTLDMLEGSPNCSMNFTTLIIESPCYFNQGNDKLDSAGCQAGMNTAVGIGHCRCSHLTSFASGFIAAPNPIDWSAVLANASFLDSPTIYSTIICIMTIYILAAIWARRKDMKDVERIGITPLQDNDPLDHYYYEVTVQTGRKTGAGTKSKVFMVVSGDWEETGVRYLQDEKRRPFKLGSTDYFLMATPRPLGKLHYVRIWHDNSAKGRDQSWFCSYIIIHDLHTRAKYYFVCNQWLAVERGDGQVDRLLPVADRESVASFNMIFTEKTTKDISDEHIWFSVVGRPAISRFTRLQRVTCCLCVLFTAMLANVLWYGQDDTNTKNVLTIGPLALSPKQVGIGVMSNLITFPINFLIVYLFRNSRPRRKRKSRVTTAIEKNKEEKKKQRKESTKSSDQMLLLSDDTGMIPFELESRPVSQISRGSTTSYRGRQVAPPPELLPDDDFEYDEEGQRVKKKKKKKIEFPWWCIIIGWILCFITVLACGSMVVIYGLSMGEKKTQKWLGSMMIAFLSSVLLTQPIKVILVAAIFALIFKTPSANDDDETERDEESYELGWDEEWLHPPVDEDGFGRPTRIGYRPPDPAKLEADRARRLKEVKMMEVIREIIIYAFFLWVLMVVSYDIRDPNAFLIKDNLVKVFVAEGSIGPSDLNNVQTLAHFWYYVEKTLTTGLRADKWYNDQQPYGQRGFMSDRTSRIMGFAVMRQTRVPPARCEPPAPMDKVIYECNIGYSIANEDTQSYGSDGWFSPVNGTCDRFPPHEYCYRGWKELNGYPWVGRANLYGGGGYVAEMRGSLEVLQRFTRKLQADGWVDKYTRAIFTEFTVYNAYVNLFGIVTILTEKLTTGGFLISYRVEPVNLLPSNTDFYLFTIICQFVFCCFILYLTIRLIIDLRKQKMKYFSVFWNWVEIWIIALSYGSIVTYIYRYFVAKQLTNLFKISHGNAYMKFQYVGWWNELLTYMIGWVVFLSTIKFLLLLRFNKRIGLLGATLQEAAKSLSAFSVLFGVFFFAFCCLFYGVYGSELLSYATIIITAETLLSTMLGKFEYDEMRTSTAGYGGSFMFLLYICVMAFIVLNMFISILNESFAVVKDDVAKQNNDYEIIDFMIYRFKGLLGIAGSPPDSLNAKESDIAALRMAEGEGGTTDVLAMGEPDQLPERIDEFLERVTDLYFPGDPMSFKSKTKGGAASSSTDPATYTEAEKKMILKELEKDSSYRY